MDHLLPNLYIHTGSNFHTGKEAKSKRLLSFLPITRRVRASA